MDNNEKQWVPIAVAIIGAMGAILAALLLGYFAGGRGGGSSTDVSTGGPVGAGTTPTTLPVTVPTTVVATSPTIPNPTTPGVVKPMFPTTPEAAAEVFGVSNSDADFHPIGCCGWMTTLAVPLRMYPGLCVDFDINVDPARVITGETYFVESNGQFHRALFKSAGTIVGGATIYWSTCNHIA